MDIAQRKELFKEVKAILKNLKIPKEPVVFLKGQIITNPEMFVKSHVSFVSSYLENEKLCFPYFIRLIKFVQLIQPTPETESRINIFMDYIRKTDT